MVTTVLMFNNGHKDTFFMSYTFKHSNVNMNKPNKLFKI